MNFTRERTSVEEIPWFEQRGTSKGEAKKLWFCRKQKKVKAVHRRTAGREKPGD